MSATPHIPPHILPNILIVEARFYAEIADELVAGATAFLEANGATFERLAVPGAFEIPAAIAMAAKASRKGGTKFDGYVALGCVIRGQTSHYDYVCGESARALQDLAVGKRLAIGYGILTVEDRDQAWIRADRKTGDKGRVAAEAALAMLAIRKHFGIGG